MEETGGKILISKKINKNINNMDVTHLQLRQQCDKL